MRPPGSPPSGGGCAALLVLTVPAHGALTRTQQACVVGANASWQKLAAAFTKATDTCIEAHDAGTPWDALPTYWLDELDRLRLP
ncbi:MAG: hypothetical protein IT294_13360 [Deltaproteobacteria bacterium]|nr:hypothetical protein [Deltaproteobacteria bacterium]